MSRNNPPLPADAPVLWFDYVDPASFVVDHLLGEVLAELPGRRVEAVHRPLEVIPPDRPLLDPGDPGWRDHLAAATEAAAHERVDLRPPAVVPWSRKAHELAFHAREQGCFAAIHRAIFHGYFLDGRDIGRVDQLVEIAVQKGLDATAARVVLDVDRFAEAVLEERQAAAHAGIMGLPTLVLGTARLTGLRDRGEIRAFLSPLRNGPPEPTTT